MNVKYTVCVIDRPISQDTPFLLRRPFEECAKICSELGYDGMELQIQDPRPYLGKDLKQMLERHNLKTSSVTTGLAYTFEGLSMTDEDTTIRLRCVERLKRQLDLAKELDSQILLGFIRGRKKAGETEAHFEDKLTDSMEQLLEYAKELNTPVVFEQINKNDGDVYNTTERTMQFLEKFNSDLLLFNGDTYHMATEDKDVAAAIRCSISKLVLFHVSDVGRLLPDDRHFDFEICADTLQELNYHHWLTLECKPLPDEITAVKVGIAYLKKRFPKD